MLSLFTHLLAFAAGLFVAVCVLSLVSANYEPGSRGYDR